MTGRSGAVVAGPRAPAWRRPVTLAALVATAAYLVGTGLTGQGYGLDVLSMALIFGLYAAGVDLCWGQGGVLLLGSALFFGVGAYGMALSLRAGIEPIVATALIVTGSVLLGLLLAWIGFRSRAAQVQFGLIGLAVALAFERIAVSAYSVTGGSNGIAGISRPVLGGVMPLSTPQRYYWFVLAITGAVMLAVAHARRSAWGQAVRAVRDDAERARSLGYPVGRLRYQVVATSAAMIALAGTLFPAVAGTAYPALFGIGVNMQALVWVAIGGTGTLFGPFALAAVLRVLESYLAGIWTEYYVLVLGVVFVLVVVNAPGGIGGAIATQMQRLEARADRRTIGSTGSGGQR